MMPVIPSDDNFDTGWANETVGDGDSKGSGGNLGEWSSLIGIVTAIGGNILIALALNVQRYSHIQLHRRKAEAKERAREIMKRLQNDRPNGYGTTETSSLLAETHGGQHIDGQLPHEESYQSSQHSEDEIKVASTYLKSPSWWLGQVLMTVGEMGNFLAYGFAPASIVSPLGVVALISNCVIAPLFFGEIFRARDFWGVLIAIAGAVTVVLSAKHEENKLDPTDVWGAITTVEFEVYMAVTISLIIILMWASPKFGNRTILIDLGLVGLFGGYTALTTKGVSSMLSSTLWRAFTTPVTYVLVIILLGTAVMQVRYVNKALQRFDSTQVIPIQFVLFTLSVIIGSAVLYRDFERTTSQQALKFIGGCLLTFFGVFLITSGRPRHDEDELSDDEGVEETISLRDQEASGLPGVRSTEQQQESAQSSRRSSHASHVSFVDQAMRPLTVQRDSGVPSLRKPDASGSRTALPADASPVLNNPWQDSPEDQQRPQLPPAFSDDSVVTIYSATSANSENLPAMSSASLPAPVIEPPTPPIERPMTPRHSLPSSRSHSHHFSNTIISPSPLSSTVSAVVADALLRGEDSPVPRRKSIRRTRPSIRSSLFVPSAEFEGAEGMRESDALLQSPEELDQPEQGREHRTIRGRARSVSHTLGELFGRKKRRNTNPEVGIGHENPSSGLINGNGNVNGAGLR